MASKQEFEALKAEVALLRQEMEAMRGELRDLTGKKASSTGPQAALPEIGEPMFGEEGSLGNEGLIDKALFEQLEACADEDSPNFVQEVVQMFFDGVVEKLPEMTQQLEDMKLAEFARNAHWLKGSSGGIGAMRVVELCKVLQHLGESKDKQKCLAAFDLLKEEIEKVRKYLSKKVKII